MSFGKNHNNSNQNQSFNQNQILNGTDLSNQNTTFNQNTTGSTTGTTTGSNTPTNPAWVDALGAALGGGVSDLSGQDPRSFIAGADPLQTEAGASAGGLGAGDPHAFGAASDATGYILNANAPHTAGVQASQFINQYQDPYQNDVINSTLADYDHQAGLTNAQDDLTLAGSGAFGGSGAALTKAATAGELARGRATTESTLRSQGFARALGAAQQDAGRLQGAKDLNANLYGQQMDRSLGAAQQLAGLQTAQDANTRANITTQAGVGDQIRQIAQQYAQSPIDFQNALSQLFAGLPLGLFHGDTTAGTTTGTTVGNQSGTQDQTGNDTQSGTTATTGNSTGSGSSTGFGFKLGGG